MPALRLPVPSGTSSVPRPMRGIHCRFGAYIQQPLREELKRSLSDFDAGEDTKGKQRRRAWIPIYKREVPIAEDFSLSFGSAIFQSVTLLLPLWHYTLCHRGECRFDRCARSFAESQRCNY